MEQDRNLDVQRSRERLEQAADLALAELTNRLSEWDIRLRELDTLPPPIAWGIRLPPGGTFILLTSRSAATYPPKPLLFVPAPPSPSGALPGVFETAEQLEHRQKKFDQAIEALRPLVERPATRAEALLRTARLQRKLNRPEAALVAYTRLSQETTVSPSGTPYALLAAAARCRILAASDDQRRAISEVGLLSKALLEGRWPLRRETFEYYWEETSRLQHVAFLPTATSWACSGLNRTRIPIPLPTSTRRASYWRRAVSGRSCSLSLPARSR
ncbi:MAG TPA: hypothetical protein VE398_11340 [Acidobacteriota bacterium]|nr:hypothetical protein [Acidobacteriota bacterium]